MAKEISLSERTRMLQAGIVNRARAIGEYAKRLETLGGDLEMDPNQKAIFLLCCRSIQADVNSLASEEDRSSD